MNAALLLSLALAQLPMPLVPSLPSTPPPAATPPPSATPQWTRVPVTPQLTRWQHPQLVAELRGADGHFVPQVARSLTAHGAALALEKGRVRLWRTPDAAALLAALPDDVTARLVPALSTQPTTAARVEVPVGGVVVQLAPGTDARALARQHGWALQADLGGGVWRLASAPGHPALALAGAAASVPGVRLAMPELWRPGVLK